MNVGCARKPGTVALQLPVTKSQLESQAFNCSSNKD